MLRKGSSIYRSRENSRDMSSYNRERSLYREDSRENERLLHERGRSRVSTSLERSKRERVRRRERSTSEEDYRGYREIRREKRSEKSESREIRNHEEIAELRSTVSELIEEVRELHRKNESRTRIPSMSPDPSANRNPKRARNNLEPMNSDYKKAFRDNVVQILKSLDDSLKLDHEKRWTDIETRVIRSTIPAIKRVIGDRFQYTDTELKKVLQNLHRHRRDAYTVSLKPSKSKANNQRMGTNSRRKKKKDRRKRGLHHMLDTNDQMLTDLQPSMEWEDWIKDLKKVVGDSMYHSDEVSESDDEKAQEEKNKKIRPSINENSNHVIHVYNKDWRSQRVQQLLRHADLIGESIQNVKVARKRWYDDDTYVDNSKPPSDALKWTISSSYRSE